MSTVVVGEDSDSPEQVDLRVGDELVVELEENGTTGFEWQDATSEPSGVLGQVHSEFEPGTGGAGAAGRRRFVVTAAKPGEASLTLALRRSWEVGREPRRSVTISVAVQEGR